MLGTYGQDFYKGEAALTVNQYGKGQAYYIASFAEDSFYLDFYQKLAGELALTRALPQLPPEGVEACLRESDDTQYLFLQNFTGRSRPSPCRRAMWTWRATPPRRPLWTCTTAKCSCGKRRKPGENTRGESQN